MCAVLCLSVKASDDWRQELAFAESHLPSTRNAQSSRSRDESADITTLNNQTSSGATLTGSKEFKSFAVHPAPVLHSSGQSVRSALVGNPMLHSLPIDASEYKDLLQQALTQVSAHSQQEETNTYQYSTPSWTFAVTVVKGTLLYATITDIIRRLLTLAQPLTGRTSTRVGVVKIQDKPVADVAFYSNLPLPSTVDDIHAFNTSTDVSADGTVRTMTYTEQEANEHPTLFNNSLLNAFADSDLTEFNTKNIDTNPKQKRVNIYNDAAIAVQRTSYILSVNWAVNRLGVLPQTSIFLFRTAVESALNRLITVADFLQSQIPPSQTAYALLRSGVFDYKSGEVAFDMRTTMIDAATGRTVELFAGTWRLLAEALLERLESFRPDELLYSSFGEILMRGTNGNVVQIGKWALTIRGHDEL